MINNNNGNRPPRTWKCFKCHTEYPNTLLYCPDCNIARKHSFTLEEKYKRKMCTDCDPALCHNDYSKCIKIKEKVVKKKNGLYNAFKSNNVKTN